jgi:hypothetical protein
MIEVKMHSDLVKDGYDSILCEDSNLRLSASDIEDSTFIGCGDDGIVTLQLRDGKPCTVNSIDLDYINTGT